MTLDEFVAKWEGRKIDFDGAYGGQCFDLYRQYCFEVLNVPQSPPTGTKGAVTIWDTYLTDYFDRVSNTPEGVPSKGDIVIWGTKIGTYGHVAIFLSGGPKRFTSFDQNFPEGSACHQQTHDYTGVLGWLTPKVKEEVKPDIRLQLLDDAQIKDEGTTREAIGAWKDKPALDKTITELREQLDGKNKEFEGTKTELIHQLDEAEKTAKLRKEQYTEFVRSLAQALGTTQEEAVILAAVEGLVKKEDRLEAIKDNRPLTRHPFEGVGEMLRKILGLTIKILQKWVKPKK